MCDMFKTESLGSGQGGVIEASLTASFVSHLPKIMIFSLSEFKDSSLRVIPVRFVHFPLRLISKLFL